MVRVGAAGPWRGLWLRRGYDPRSPALSDEDLKLARGYQGLELKLPAKRCGAPTNPPAHHYFAVLQPLVASHLMPLETVFLYMFANARRRQFVLEKGKPCDGCA